MNEPIDLLASCAFGLESVVKRELFEMGVDAKVVTPGKLRFHGDLAAIIKTNLRLRTADRISIEMARFPAADFDALFDTTRDLSWAQWLPPNAEFPVRGRSRHSKLSSVPACQRAVKRAIVESLKRDHQTSTLPETGPLFPIEIAILNDEAVLTIDTTGASLHKRGYRKLQTAAPLKETMAAALVLLSFWNGDRPFLDPFCGSGTIPIEAALIARKIAPGVNRSFVFESWPSHDPELIASTRTELQAQALPSVPERLWAADCDRRVLHAARLNAEAAGVADDIHFQQREFRDTTSRREFGCMISNPPYGERLGDRDEAEQLYRDLPFVLRNLPTWSYFILSSRLDLEKLIQKEASKRRKLYNGRIECTYFQFHGPPPFVREKLSITDGPTKEPVDAENHSEERLKDDRLVADHDLDLKDEARPSRETSSNKPRQMTPVFGGLSEKSMEQAELFRRRLQKRIKHLRRYPTRQGITCYRVYERDVPEIPLVVDRYESYAHVVEFERPHERDLAEHADWLDQMCDVIAEVLGIERRSVYLKRRERQRGKRQHEKTDDQNFEVDVSESGLKFRVNLSDYTDTGLFLDHRITRQMVRDKAEGQRVLNLFGYTGSFSVFAAAGGAKQVTTVDLSQTYLRWTETNFRLNQIDTSQHPMIRSDAIDFVRNLPPTKVFDLIVVDPPTFSNSKRNDDDWDIQRDYVAILHSLLAHLTPGGTLFFSTNFKRFKFDESQFDSVTIQEISRQTVPPEYRNRRIHRCWRLIRAEN